MHVLHQAGLALRIATSHKRGIVHRAAGKGMVRTSGLRFSVQASADLPRRSLLQLATTLVPSQPSSNQLICPRLTQAPPLLADGATLTAITAYRNPDLNRY